MILGDAMPSATAPKVVLDNDALNAVAETEGVYEAVREAVETGRLVVLWTHVTIDEAARTPDLDLRCRKLTIGASIAWLVQTSEFVFDVSRFNLARFGPDDTSTGFASLQRGRAKDTRDALVGATARVEGAMLATYDGELTQRARGLGIKVIDVTKLPSIVERSR